MLFFTPPVVPNCSTSDSVRLGVRSGANNSLGRFFSIIGGCGTTLRTHPRVGSTGASFGPRFPRCRLSVSTTTYGGTNVDPGSVLAALRKCCNNLCTSGFGDFNGVCHMVMRTRPSTAGGVRALRDVGIHGNGRVTPVARFVSVGGMCNPSIVDHFGLCASVGIVITPTSNCASNRTLRTVTRITRRGLPTNFNCRLKNVTHRRTRADNDAAKLVFVLYFMFICLLLDTRCRDCVLPLSMLLSIPFNLLNDFLFMNNVNTLNDVPTLGVVLNAVSGSVCVRVTLVVLVNLLTGGTVLVMRFTLRHHEVNVDVA